MGDGRDGLDQRTSNYGDGSRNTHDNSDLWASRIVSYYVPQMLLYDPHNHSNHLRRIVTVMMTTLRRYQTTALAVTILGS